MFWNRFIEICNEKGTTPTAVVTALKISGGSVTKWKNGSTPRGTTLLKLSEYFGVSADYLLNISLEENEIIKKSCNKMNIFWKRFVSECERVGKKPNPVGQDVGVSSGTVTGWKNGVVPKPECLQRIADYFGCTTDYLLGISSYRTPNDSSAMFTDLTEQEKTLLRLFRETTEEGRFEMITAFMNIKTAIEKKPTSENTSAVG